MVAPNNMLRKVMMMSLSPKPPKRSQRLVGRCPAVIDRSNAPPRRVNARTRGHPAFPSISGTKATVYATEGVRSEEHTSELQSLMRISYAVFCLKKKNNANKHTLSHN